MRAEYSSMCFTELGNSAVIGLYKVTLWVTICRPCIYCELKSFLLSLKKRCIFLFSLSQCLSNCRHCCFADPLLLGKISKLADGFCDFFNDLPCIMPIRKASTGS